MAEPILSVQGVNKHFGGVSAVRDISFDVRAGEVVGLMGPNGAGKSTLLNLIAGTYKPDSGKLQFKGHDITGIRPHKICHLGIARTYQIPQPFVNLSPRQNMLIAAMYGRGLSKPAAEAEATRLLNVVNLPEREEMVCKEMATLALKKLELARALASNPTLLLLDEVAAGSTEAEIPRVLAIIKGIREMGKTIILVEHVMRVMIEAVDRLIVMDKGAKIAEGAPKEVINDKRVVEAYFGY